MVRAKEDVNRFDVRKQITSLEEFLAGGQEQTLNEKGSGTFEAVSKVYLGGAGIFCRKIHV